MKNKNLVVILCYCDTQSKLDLLSNMVESLKDKYDIMISTHSAIPLKIQKDIDYLVYDKSNPILRYPERGMQFWKKILDISIKITHIMDDYGWTVFNLKQNAISLGKNLDHDYYSFINYDIEITKEVLKTLDNPKDFICSNFIDPNSKKSLFPSLLFNILSKDNANKINNLISKKSYTESLPGTDHALYFDAEAYWGKLISNFDYVKLDTKIEGILETGNSDVLNYNKLNNEFRLFFDQTQLLVYDNLSKHDIKLNINTQDITITQVNQLIELPTIENIGFYHDKRLIDLTDIYHNKDRNKIENF
jgi:hypothetical protein